MAPARPFWKGYLKLSLVSCPIALYAGTSSTERVSFRQINKKTGNRLRQQLVDEVTRAPLEGEDKGRGYEYAKNAYIPVDDDELDALALESKHTIEIDSFVPREQIDQRYLDSPYYITPSDRVGQDAFAVIREAMRGKRMVALGRVVLAKRERVIMLEPWDKGLTATTLRYPYEIRDAREYFDHIPDIELPPDMLKLAEQILRRKTTDFDPSHFVDRYEEAIVEMLGKKQAGMPISRESAKSNLFDTSSWGDFCDVTLTLKQGHQPDRSGWVKIDDYRCRQAFRHFMNLLNRAVYGSAFRRYGKRLRVLPVLEKGEVRARALRSWERGTSGRWHIHCAIELPSHFDAVALENLICDCWAKVEWGHGRILVRDGANAGWISYMLNDRQKSEFDGFLDCIIIESLHNPIADA